MKGYPKIGIKKLKQGPKFMVSFSEPNRGTIISSTHLGEYPVGRVDVFSEEEFKIVFKSTD